MKIILFSYTEGAAVDQASTAVPSFQIRPETAITRSDWPFFVPDWSVQVEAAPALVVRLGRLGKSIPARFASRYFEAYTAGVVFTAADRLQQLIAQQQPWEAATAFDGSVYAGQHWLSFAPASSLALSFSAHTASGEAHFTIQGDLFAAASQALATVSTYMMVKTGDLLFLTAPRPLGIVSEGDLLTGQIGEQPLMECRCK